MSRNPSQPPTWPASMQQDGLPRRSMRTGSYRSHAGNLEERYRSAPPGGSSMPISHFADFENQSARLAADHTRSHSSKCGDSLFVLGTSREQAHANCPSSRSWACFLPLFFPRVSDTESETSRQPVSARSNQTSQVHVCNRVRGRCRSWTASLSLDMPLHRVCRIDSPISTVFQVRFPDPLQKARGWGTGTCTQTHWTIITNTAFGGSIH